jgi:hypothetical protein
MRLPFQIFLNPDEVYDRRGRVQHELGQRLVADLPIEAGTVKVVPTRNGLSLLELERGKAFFVEFVVELGGSPHLWMVRKIKEGTNPVGNHCDSSNSNAVLPSGLEPCSSTKSATAILRLQLIFS